LRQAIDYLCQTEIIFSGNIQTKDVIILFCSRRHRRIRYFLYYLFGSSRVKRMPLQKRGCERWMFDSSVWSSIVDVFPRFHVRLSDSEIMEMSKLLETFVPKDVVPICIAYLKVL
jgi:hypothetical protein